jgi:hypothetical protein
MEIAANESEPLSTVRQFLRAFATAARSLEEKRKRNSSARACAWRIASIVITNPPALFAPLFTEVVTVYHT